jgi:hypothetical protein
MFHDVFTEHSSVEQELLVSHVLCVLIDQLKRSVDVEDKVGNEELCEEDCFLLGSWEVFNDESFEGTVLHLNSLCYELYSEFFRKVFAI